MSFTSGITPPLLNEDERRVHLQALAGMLWSKQYYYFDLDRWLKERDAHPLMGGGHRASRNAEWFHMFNGDILSMPDKQEYRVDYVPAESDTGMFGGNSNWRGPVWMPVNALITRGLLNLCTFYECFHGDNGAGLGASHQTGWTGVIARLLDLFGRVDAADALLLSKERLSKRLVREQVGGKA